MNTKLLLYVARCGGQGVARGDGIERRPISPGMGMLRSSVIVDSVKKSAQTCMSNIINFSLFLFVEYCIIQLGPLL